MGCEKRPPDQQMQVTEIRIPARNQPISSLRCDYITQATKQVRSADRENNRYCNGNVVEQLHDQLASSIGKGTALAPNENKMSDGGRGRASVGFEVWRSSQEWSAQRSAVRSIAWLGVNAG